MQSGENKHIIYLKKLLNEHLKMPFPEIASLDNELQDMKGEIALYGGHVTGLVDSYLQSAPVNPDFVKIDLELEKRMQSFKPKTEGEMKDIKTIIIYKHKLDELVASLADLLTENK